MENVRKYKGVGFGEVKLKKKERKREKKPLHSKGQKKRDKKKKNVPRGTILRRRKVRKG